MNYDHDVRAPIPALEHSKFIEIKDDTRYPAVSVVRIKYPESSLMVPISTTEIYPKHAVLTYIANPEDISSGGGSTNVVTDSLLNSLTSQVSRIESLVDTLTAQNLVKVLNWTAVSVLVADHPIAFPNTLATTVSIINNTGVGLLIKNGTSTPTFPLPWGGAIEISTIANANEIVMIREDGSNTPVEVFGFVTLKG